MRRGSNLSEALQRSAAARWQWKCKHCWVGRCHVGDFSSFESLHMALLHMALRSIKHAARLHRPALVPRFAASFWHHHLAADSFGSVQKFA